MLYGREHHVKYLFHLFCSASGNYLWRDRLLEAMAFHVLFIFNLLRFSDP